MDRVDELAEALYQQSCGEDWDFTFDIADALREYAKEAVEAALEQPCLCCRDGGCSDGCRCKRMETE